MPITYTSSSPVLQKFLMKDNRLQIPSSPLYFILCSSTLFNVLLLQSIQMMQKMRSNFTFTHFLIESNIIINMQHALCMFFSTCIIFLSMPMPVPLFLFLCVSLSLFHARILSLSLLLFLLLSLPLLLSPYFFFFLTIIAHHVA